MAEKKLFKHSVTRVITPIALSLFLVACETGPKHTEYESITNIQALGEQNSSYYLTKAETATGNAQINLLLHALHASVREENIELGERIIRRLAQTEMNAQQQALSQLDHAELLLLKQQPADAMRQLYFDPTWVLDTQLWKRYYQLRAKVKFSLHETQEALTELLALYNYLDDNEKREHSNTIWSHLQATSFNELQSINVTDFELQGWLQLATDSKLYANNTTILKRHYLAFFDQNSNHQAVLYTPTEIQEILDLEVLSITNTALLLPTTGKFAKQANLIRDGFVFAMLNDQQRDPDFTYSLINTDNKSADELMLQLHQKTADFIVGPLVKSQIEAMQEVQAHQVSPIPMLALNFPEKLMENSLNCYITLSPEQEAKQAATHLYQQGHRFPLFIAPKNNYGQRMEQAFEQQWQMLSTTKSDSTFYTKQSQLQNVINTIFDIKESKTRIAKLGRLLDIDLESEPRSRRDVDAVYIVASDSNLNLIKPFINVVINPETTPPKLYASSISNSGVKKPSLDLSGVSYSDIPMLIEPTPDLQTKLNDTWSDATYTQQRLYALGMDAYNLLRELPNMMLDDQAQLQGQTGLLTVNDQCIIERQLSWSEYGLEANSRENNELDKE